MPNNIPQVALELIDYTLIAVYLAALIGVGLYYRRYAQEDLEHFFLAGRRFPGWMSGTSYAVTCMNADVAPAYCGMTVITGVYICWWYISRFGFALMIGAVLFAVVWWRLKIFTSPEFYELRFSGAPAVTMRTLVSLRSAFIAVVAWTGSGLLGLSKISQGLLGWDQLTTFALVIPVILFYVILSGYIGVVLSDMFQALILTGSAIVLMVLVWSDFGGPQGLYTSLTVEFGEGVVSWHPPASHELLGLIGVIAWTVGTAVGYGGDIAPMAVPMEGQRVLSCRSGREASKMYVWSEITMFLMVAVLTLPALAAMVKWPGLHYGSIDKELSYGMLLGHYLPPGLLGLALVALFASIMSTIDSNMNFGAQVFINDVYRRLIHPSASSKHCLRVGKLVMLVIISLAILVATQARNIIDIVVFMLGISSAEITANWGQWWWWRFNGAARLSASIGGPLIFLFNRFVVFRFFIDAGQDTPYLIVLASITATCLLWITVASLTKPDPEYKLIEFYRRTRPPGRWGPIARKAGIEPIGFGPIADGLGIALLGTTAVAAGTISFSCLYIARWGVAATAAIVSAVAGFAFKRAYTSLLQSAD